MISSFALLIIALITIYVIGFVVTVGIARIVMPLDVQEETQFEDYLLFGTVAFAWPALLLLATLAAIIYLPSRFSVMIVNFTTNRRRDNG